MVSRLLVGVLGATVTLLPLMAAARTAQPCSTVQPPSVLAIQTNLTDSRLGELPETVGSLFLKAVASQR